MTRIALIAACALAVALSAALLDRGRLKARNTSLEASLAASEKEREQLKQANEVHRAHLARMADDRREQQERIDRLRDMEGGDAPLSDFLDGSAGLLWP